jgi:general secretion pathway protein D
MNKHHYLILFFLLAGAGKLVHCAENPLNSPHVSLQDSERTDIASTPGENSQTGQLNPVVLTDSPLALPVIPSADTVLGQINEAQAIPKKDIYLNFENTTLGNFVTYMAELKNLNIIPDKGIDEAKISLTIRDPLSVDGAWSVFLTVLETSGFSMIKSGEVWKVLPKDKKLTEALPSYINVSPDTLPNSDLEIRYVMFLQNIKVTDVKDLLISMLSTPNGCIDHQDANAFIITDKSYNIKAAAKLLLELDQIGLQETVTVMQLKKANAKDVAELLGALIKKPDANPLARLLGKTAEGATEYFSSTTRIIPEERTNSLILLGNNASIDKIIKFITSHIDTELVAAASPLHIYECKHTDASAMKDILEQVTQAPESSVGQAAGKYGAIRGGVKYFKSMSFQVDKDGNRLIVSCTDKHDWKMLKKTLKDLDKPQPQVAIETLIVTVNSSDIKQLGGMVRNKKHGQIGHNVDFQSVPLTGKTTQELSGGTTGDPVSLLGNLINQLVSSQGSTLLSFGKAATGNIWSVFNILKQQTNATVLSQPFITVSNKTAATIKIGEEKRVVTEVAESGNKSFESVPVNTSIDVTPQINLEGLIRLDMTVTIQDFANDDGTIRNDKTVKTSITVANGQVLVLGGFVKTKVSEDKAKTPILSDIPVLGWFFKNQKRSITKDYIFIFMVPTIIKPRQTPGTQLYTKMKMHAATESIEQAVQTSPSNDPVHNWFFNPDKENYSHKVIDFANARYQPTTVDIRNDPYYRSQTRRQELEEEKKNTEEEQKLRRHALELDATPITQQKNSPTEPVDEKKLVGLDMTQPKPAPQLPLTQSSGTLEKLVQELPLTDINPPKLVREIAQAQDQQLLAAPRQKNLSQPAQPTIQYDRRSPEQTAFQVPSENDLEAKRRKLKALLNGLPADAQYYAAEPDTPYQPLEKKRTRMKNLIAHDLPEDKNRAQFKQTIASLPDEQQKREQLKTLLNPQDQGSSELPIEQKRQQLKDIFADKSTSIPVKTDQFVDPSKRNKLKEFLAQQAAQEKNLSSASRFTRKATA